MGSKERMRTRWVMIVEKEYNMAVIKGQDHNARRYERAGCYIKRRVVSHLKTRVTSCHVNAVG
jgi:hypothetical protein